MRSQLRLESLDGRIVPDATPTLQNGTVPVQIATADQQVTDIAVFKPVDETGQFMGSYIFVEKAGSAYILTAYETSSNLFFTGTESIETVLAVTHPAELVSLVTLNGYPGSLSNILFASSTGTLLPSAQIQVGLPASTNTPNQVPAPQPAVVLSPAQPAPQPGVVLGPIPQPTPIIIGLQILPPPGTTVPAVPPPTTTVYPSIQLQQAITDRPSLNTPTLIQPTIGRPIFNGSNDSWLNNHGIQPIGGGNGPGIGFGFRIRR